MPKKKAAKANAKNAAIDFSTAFKYPFNRLAGLFNILWFLFIIVGWFALFGYSVKIVREFVDGKFRQLPVFRFKENLKLGFPMFFKFLPLLLAVVGVNIILMMIPILGILGALAFDIFVVPMLAINFFVKGTVESSFDIKKVHAVFNNIEDYLVVILKSIGLGLIFFIMIFILVGIPASVFGKNIFLADFYRRKARN